MSKTIIISNRLPLQLQIDNNTIKATPSVGGLATGMKSVHRDSNGVWIGWTGLTEEETPEEAKLDLKFEEDDTPLTDEQVAAKTKGK